MTAVALQAARIRVRGATVLAGAVLVVATLVAWWAGEPYVVGVWHDDGVYALLGRALATGHGFHYTQLPGAPAAAHYPPAYPLLLAAVWRLAPSFPDNIAAFLAVNAMLAGVAALGIYRYARRRLAWHDEGAAAMAVVATLTTPVLTLSSAVLSEPLFLAALWPTLTVAERAAHPSAGRRHALAAGAAIGALTLVRTHAAALLFALVLLLAVRRRVALALWAGAAGTAVALPWQLWTMLAAPRVPAPLAGAYGSYLGWFAQGVREGGLPFVLATARLNLRELWLLLQDRVVVGDALAPRLIATALLVALIVVGARALARRNPVTVCFVAIYLAIVVIWPYAPWRFVWAVWPLLLLCAVAGGLWLRARAPTVPTRAVLAVALAVPAYGMLRTEARAYAARTWLTPAANAGAQIVPLVAWVNRSTRPNDVVLAEGEQVVSLFTGRQAAPTASFSAREYVASRSVDQGVAQLREIMTLVNARYVLPMDPVQLEAARALVGARPGLREVARLPRSRVFEVLR